MKESQKYRPGTVCWVSDCEVSIPKSTKLVRKQCVGNDLKCTTKSVTVSGLICQIGDDGFRSNETMLVWI
jgi:hypothetical protein